MKLESTYVNTKHGFNQNLDEDFSLSRRPYPVVCRGQHRIYYRYCNKELFTSMLVNSEPVKSFYLSYSVSTCKIYCVPCYLFGNKSHLSRNGFCDWKHPNQIKKHENSIMHKTCCYKMKKRSSKLG